MCSKETSIIVGIILAFLPLLGWNNIKERRRSNIPWSTNCQATFILPGSYIAFITILTTFTCILVTMLYGHIYVIARRQAKALQRATAIFTVQSLAIPTPNSDHSQGHGTTVRHSRRGIPLMIVMVVLYIFSTLPVCFRFSIDSEWWTVEVVSEKHVPSGGPKELIGFSILLNIFCNPYIYGLGNREIRNVGKSLVKKNSSVTPNE